ncbi:MULTISPECIES: dihydrolipoyl dehydrogenase [unclassified Paenibacillus]|uniref:dihydrolipoyl dehydrogenase n=1 Tax=unclassified Paenibacillus TaxID=185978 RepID=UPI001AEA8524|nr:MULTISPECIES: dihydrolipoyl dehydrogenase [unclassified Paenibacillus]MBP1156499.1 dihydrolipoamide dehydrogenase [Paenibacillus sp. PvP091]MBP1168115.1 dihydrolipoamide dehydrogenase [Paenibacillus sp. PvR098]MBP2439143.1 dihydrolipoamide dehydrogenase [Paenibacillus sp. PvP052]
MVVGDASVEIDVLVIGAGPGGYVAAIRASQLGKSVLVVDKAELGGVCLNRGCIPSKALISAAHQYEMVSHADSIGITAENVKIDFTKVQEWKTGIVKKQSGGVGMLLKGNKVQVFQGEALFINENEARVFNDNETARYRFNHCIIATGSRPIELKTFPFGGRVISSTEALSLNEIPKSMVVIGGGYIGIELGQTYAKFGTKVTVLEGSDSILPGFEKDLSQPVARNLKKLDVEVVTEAMAQGCEQTDKDVTVTYTVKGEEKKVTADYVLVTVGRRPNTDGDLSLELAGVEVGERGLIQVNDKCQTNVPHIYAIGDIVPGPALAHKASYEAKVAAESIAGLPSVVDYKVIPAVVFSDPEIAGVGLSETEAKGKGINVIVGKFPYGANGRAQSMNATDGFVKLIGDKDSGLLVGGYVVGAEASNLIAELTLAIEMGATLEDIALTIHAHPTLGEITMDAAEGALGHPIHQLGK